MAGKSQAALEFIMTYGWAVMVVLIAIAALSYFGVLSPDQFLPGRCIIEAGIACLDFEIETDKIVLVLQNSLGEDLTIDNLSMESCDCTISERLNNGEKKNFIISGCDNQDGSRFDGDISLKYSGLSGLQHTKSVKITTKVKGSTGIASCGAGGNGGRGSPLNEITSQQSANINNSLPPDWNGAKGGDNNIVLKLFNDVSYDIYLESFTLSWNDFSVRFEHFQHLTQANGWSKVKIYGDVDESSPVSGVFDDKGDPEENLRIPPNEYTIIDDLHFDEDINLPTEFNLTLNFNDSTTSVLRFTIK